MATKRKTRKGAKKNPLAKGKISMSGYQNAGKQLLFLTIGVAGGYAIHQGYVKYLRPAAITPDTTPAMSGVAGVAITYAEPLIIGIGALTLMQMAKSDFWKTAWLGASVYAGAKIINNVGRDMFKTNLLGGIEDKSFLPKSLNAPDPVQQPALRIQFPAFEEQQVGPTFNKMSEVL